jgi:hemerythrin-like domain-containing protein
MSNAPTLLNDDGTASIATALMMSHHGFRRDLRRFAQALDRIARGDTSRAIALREEWQKLHAALHGHHESEDNGLFPSLSREQESVRATIEKLGADHRRIDPLLERGDRAFAELPKTDAAVAVVGELRSLLDPHLALEEAELIPFLRGAKEFPAPPTDEVADMYAQGFAWAMDGIAPEVLEEVHKILPGNLLARLPAARAAFDARCERVWGTTRAGASRTPIPALDDDDDDDGLEPSKAER